MDWFGIIIAVTLGLGAFMGYRRGFVQQLFDLFGIIIAIIMALKFYDPVGKALAGIFTIEETFINVFGFATTFLGVFILIAIGSSTWHKVARMTALSAVDGAAGALLGLVKSSMVMWGIILVLTSVPIATLNEIVSQSAIAVKFSGAIPEAYDTVSGFLPKSFPRFESDEGVIRLIDGLKSKNAKAGSESDDTETVNTKGESAPIGR